MPAFCAWVVTQKRPIYARPFAHIDRSSYALWPIGYDTVFAYAKSC
jgi:hypothetical protein